MTIPININLNFHEISWGVAVPTFMAAATASFYFYRKYYCHQYFTKRGIPGPEPHWLYGNLREIWCDNRHEIMVEWSKKYGSIFGYYEGPNPVLVVSDLEAIEQICVKQFPSFQGHFAIPLAPDGNDTKSLLNHMFWAHGEHWKRLRTAVNPAFSSGKLKAYSPLFAKSEEDFMALLDEKVRNGDGFDIRSIYQLLTLDIIAAIGFGIDFEVIRTKGEGNNALKDLRNIVEMSFRPQPFINFLRVFPIFANPIKALLEMHLKYFGGFFPSLPEMITQVVRKRATDEKSRRVDLLQLMVDSSDMVPNADHHSGPYKPLSEKDIVAMAMLFFFAGYETTSSMLSYLSYALARHPDVQDKLVAEIYEKYPKKAEKIEPDYETVMNNMPYLDWVCRETLRLYPVGVFIVTRFVVGEANICGFELSPKCHSAIVDVWTVHQNADLWGPEPDKFVPERFSPEQSANRPESAFLSFGYGPRQCIGIRFALFEIKQTIVKILHRYQIVEPDGGYPDTGLRVTSREGAYVPLDGVPIKLIHRR